MNWYDKHDYYIQRLKAMIELRKKGFSFGEFTNDRLDGLIFDDEGFNKNGWNREGINKITGTECDADGFSRLGMDVYGFKKDGSHRCHWWTPEQLEEHVRLVDKGLCGEEVKND